MKERITITIDKQLLKWLDAKVAERLFATRSHGLEFLARSKMQPGAPPGSFESNESER